MQSNSLDIARFLGRVLIIDNAANEAIGSLYESGQPVAESSTVSAVTSGPVATGTGATGTGGIGLMEVIAQQLPLHQPCDLVLVGSGPGSYTGLRVGLALAGGFATAWQVPLWLVTSLACYVEDGESCIACMDARAGGLYAQLFIAGLAVGRSHRLSCEQLALGPHYLESLIAQEVGRVGESLSAKLAHLIWVTPHASTLSMKWPSWDWQARTAQSKGLIRQALAGIGTSYQPPFHALHLDYLKEDDQVVTGRA